MPHEPSKPRTRARRRRLALLGTATGVVAATALATVGAIPFAEAATITVDPLESALGFNAFIEGDTKLTSAESEGPIATGGDLAVGAVYNVALHTTGTFIVDGDAQPSALVVGGAIDYADSEPGGEVRVLNEGYVKVGDLTGTDVLNTDANNASVNTQLVAEGTGYGSTPRVGLTTQQPIDSVGPATPIDFDAAFADFRTKAAELAQCQNTVEMQNASGGTVAKGSVAPGDQISISLVSGQTNVLNVTGEDLNNMAELKFLNQPTADTPLLINVDTSGTGGALDWDVATQAGISGPQAPYILWNFGDTTELNIVGGDTVEGSIYAPDADFSDTSASNVEGQIVAKNATLGTLGANGGEIHHFPFSAQLSCETDDEPSPSITTTMPTSDAPTTDVPTSDAPTTDVPTTDVPTTDVPTTDVPTTDVPTTDVPTTDVPTTDVPTTDVPTTDVPTSEAPTTDVPTSEAPTTGVETTTPVATTPEDNGNGLPITGRSLLTMGAIAAILVAVGAVALIAVRRRTDEQE